MFPCPVPFPSLGASGCMFIQLSATCSGKGRGNSGMLLWSQTTHIEPCRRRLRADSVSSATLGPPTAPWIRDAKRRYMGTYFFRIERGDPVRLSYKEKPLTVHVTGKAWVTEGTHGRVPGTLTGRGWADRK